MSLEERFTFNCRECDFEENAKQCVQICYEFSVGFAEWFKEYPNNQPKGFNGKELIYYTTTELLEIYKQGL